MGLGGIAADQQEHFRVLNFVERVRRRAAAEDRGQPGHRRAVANPGAVVDVVRAHNQAHELLEYVILLVGAPAGRDAHDGRRAVLLLDGRQSIGHQLEGFVPRGLAKAGKSRAARGILDQRRGEPVGMVHEVEGHSSFHAQIGLVEGFAAGRFDADDPAVGHAGDRSGSPFRSTGIRSARGARFRRTRGAIVRRSRRSGRPRRNRRSAGSWSPSADRRRRWRCGFAARGRPARSRPIALIGVAVSPAAVAANAPRKVVHQQRVVLDDGPQLLRAGESSGIGPVFGGQFAEPRVGQARHRPTSTPAMASSSSVRRAVDHPRRPCMDDLPRLKRRVTGGGQLVLAFDLDDAHAAGAALAAPTPWHSVGMEMPTSRRPPGW